jgi:di/tricarboxylate transporter
MIVWLATCDWLRETVAPLDADIAKGVSSTAVAALTIVVAMVVFRCVTVAQARAATDMQVIVTIACAVGLGLSLQQSGAAEAIARVLVEGVQRVVASPTLAPLALLAVIYLLAMVFTEMITNVAVAAMLIPIAVGVAAAGGYNPRPFIMAVTLAASLSFMTPIGYQTNLMVMGPGGYQPRDYLRIGVPLALLIFVTAMIALPLCWDF